MTKSPCIFVCRLENDVCIGCKRTKEEITNWTKYSDEEKQKVIYRLKILDNYEESHKKG